MLGETNYRVISLKIGKIMSAKRYLYSALLLCVGAASVGLVATAGSLLPAIANPAAPAQMAANAVALWYFAIGLVSFCFALMPTTQPSDSPTKGKLGIAHAFQLITIAIFLVVLGDVDRRGAIGFWPTAAIAALCVCIFAAISIYCTRRYTEDYRKRTIDFDRQILRIGVPLLLIWAIFAQMGMPVGFTPLSVLVAYFAMLALGSTVAGFLRNRRKR
jgi:hypothetical protein